MELGCPSYQQLAPILKSYSVDLCAVPLNRFETYFLNATAGTVALCKAIGDPAVGILWDTFHANIEKTTWRQR